MALNKTEHRLLAEAEQTLDNYIRCTEFDSEEERAELVGVWSALREVLGNEKARADRHRERTMTRIEQNIKQMRADMDPKFRVFLKGLKK